MNDFQYSYGYLLQYSLCLEDQRKARISIENRARSGDNLADEEFPQLAAMLALEETFKADMRVALREVVRPEILEWQKFSKGIGEHLLARLLGATGDPRVAHPHHWEPNPKYNASREQNEKNPKKILVRDQPYERTIGQLWQYCGHGAKSVRQKGMTQEDALKLGNTRAKTATYLLAESCVKTGGVNGVYKLVYNMARLRFRDRTHSEPCVRCGPSGKPAQIGSPWSKGHIHASALRITGKEILRDLWLVAGGEIPHNM